MKQSVTMLGLGYIGLPTALLLANAGIAVTGYDIDSEKIEKLKNKKLFFEEKGLDTLFKNVLKKQTFTPTTTLKHSDVYIVAVPTPAKKGTAELKFVLSALDSIGEVFQDNDLIIIESTIAPRDCVDILIPKIKAWNKPFLFAHCPERAIPGNTLYEMIHNDRIVGGIDALSNEATTLLYSKFVKGNLFSTDPTTAAACKVMENTYRAVNIALANEFSQIAQKLDFNVWEAINLSNKHPRVAIHQPGPGVGGHCIPIDPWFFIDPESKNQGLIEKSLLINKEMSQIIQAKIDSLILKNKVKKPKIGLLGYAYKKNIDDSRETPSKKIFELLSKNYSVKINDPFVKNKDFLELESILKLSNILIVLTDHDLYKRIDFSRYQNIIFVYDTRNLFLNSDFKKTNIKLYQLGVKE
ncbi:MAG: hypothetical protein BroJett025_04970 [Patescibacteria group bacterium]|nr:MAG: hypothetical protein BroJett025_04970 [Patescibacteria group bacterium]